jgi:XTP/dITP diphosphohydrolase
MQRLVVATHNAHKTGEFRAILGDFFDPILDLTAFPDIPPAVENGKTFEENASIKALHASHYLPDALVLADDSGLETDALQGEPGVHSARFSGPGASDVTNREKLLRELAGKENRRARFRCVLVLAQEGNILQTCSGSVEGRIIDEERGTGGFGYDPLFVPDGFDQTFAELPPEAKNGISHRGRALKKLRETLTV